MAKVAVTGAAGRLGGFVRAALAAAGWRVTGIDTVPGEGGLIPGDAADPAFLAKVLAGHDALVHLAALPDPHRDTPFNVFRLNTDLAASAVTAAAEAGVRRLVLASSQTVLGHAWAAELRAPDYLPVDEDHPCRPEDTYSLSKATSEDLFALAARRDGAACVALRLPVVWDSAAFAAHTARRINDPVQSAKSLWAYIDGRDAGQAFVHALDNQAPGFRVYNIAAAEVFADESSATLAARWFPETPGGKELIRQQALFSSHRAAKELNFTSRYCWTRSGIEDRGE